MDILQPEKLGEPADGIALYRVPRNLILKLRHEVLGKGRAPDEAIFSCDDDLTTFHLALMFLPLVETSSVVCCASFIQKPLESLPAWQLRGMATNTEHQGKGFGRILLTGAEKILIDLSPIRLLWCNARVKAVPFYQKLGWEIISDVFEKTAGPHRQMKKKL